MMSSVLFDLIYQVEVLCLSRSQFVPPVDPGPPPDFRLWPCPYPMTTVNLITSFLTNPNLRQKNLRYRPHAQSPTHTNPPLTIAKKKEWQLGMHRYETKHYPPQNASFSILPNRLIFVPTGAMLLLFVCDLTQQNHIYAQLKLVFCWAFFTVYQIPQIQKLGRKYALNIAIFRIPPYQPLNKHPF